MKRLFITALAAAATIAPRASAQCFHFTEEHVDLLAVFWDGASNQLSLMASDDTHGLYYASNQCVVVCPESMQFILPGGTPLGNEGDVLWILPQNPYPGAPYVGVSAEQVPAGIFNDPLTIRLTRVEGPGQFILWQAGAFGSLDVKMDTRDGVGEAELITPPVGGHEHYNWGFTTSGVYRLSFQVSGQRLGQTTNTVSPETPFTFHILPLRSFENWVATNWPCECDTGVIAAGADPDFDRAANAFEYGVGSDPRIPDTNTWSAFGFVATNAQTFGAVTFNRSKTAADAACEVVAAGSLGAMNWDTLTNLHAVADQGATERVTLRDGVPAGAAPARFYELRVKLHSP